MSGGRHDENFRREWDYHYMRSVQAAISVAYDRAVWRPADEVYVALAGELERRGVESSPGGVFDAATQISRGQRPAILAAGSGRHRQPGGPVDPAEPRGYSGRHVRPEATDRRHRGVL